MRVGAAQLDVDGSGSMFAKELRLLLARMKIKLNNAQLMELWRAIDNDNSGEIMMDEFVRLIFEDSGEDEDVDEAMSNSASVPGARPTTTPPRPAPRPPRPAAPPPALGGRRRAARDRHGAAADDARHAGVAAAHAGRRRRRHAAGRADGGGFSLFAARDGRARPAR